MQETNLIQQIKKDFFSFRNGIIADSLRKLYPDGKVIFGLNVPQFMDLAKKYPKSLSLGMQLWKDKSSRETSLFSLYIIPPDKLDKETAINMIKEVESMELAEFLAFRILRHLPFANELLTIPAENLSPCSSYCMVMLKRNLNQI